MVLLMWYWIGYATQSESVWACDGQELEEALAAAMDRAREEAELASTLRAELQADRHRLIDARKHRQARRQTQTPSRK